MIGRSCRLENLCGRFVSFFLQASLWQAVLQVVGRKEILIGEELSDRGAHTFPSPYVLGKGLPDHIIRQAAIATRSLFPFSRSRFSNSPIA